MKPWLAARPGLIGCLIAAALTVPCAADLFVLHNGGQVEGTLVNVDQKPRETYVIRTAGGEVTLRRDQVKEVRSPKPAEVEYARVAPQYADTAEGQFALAEWCRQNKLLAQQTKHLERVIELDPDHAKARATLGYARYNGQWKTRDQVQRERGFVQDKTGAWRLPQQVEELERQKEQKAAEQEWFGKLRRWRGFLNGDRANEALAGIRKIADPNAVPALKYQLQNEEHPEVRLLYVDALGRIETPEALQLLAVVSLEDPIEENRLTALDYLEKHPNIGVVELYIKRLRDKDNVMVNRAAVGLARMKDPRAIRPLIDALVTKHKYLVDPGNGGSITSTFSNRGGNFGFGNSGPRYEERLHQNPAVRDALISLAGTANFDYDVRSWKHWLAAQKKTQHADARRD